MLVEETNAALRNLATTMSVTTTPVDEGRLAMAVNARGGLSLGRPARLERDGDGWSVPVLRNARVGLPSLLGPGS